MKILQVIYTLQLGGAERLVVDLSNELVRNNEVILYTLRDNSKYDDRYFGSTSLRHDFYLPQLSPKIKYHNLKIEPGFKPGLIWSFYRIIRKLRPDVVHCHLNLINYFYFSSVLFYKKTRFIYTIHNSASTEVQSGIERGIRRFFFKHRFFIPVAISDETKKSYQEFYQLNDVEVIYNGRQFNGKSPNFENVRNEIDNLKSAKDTLVFCHVSRYDKKQKNQLMLIKAINRLHDEGFEVILLIIGGGFEDIAELKEIAREHIHFLGVKSDVNDYLYASDGFCLSSEFEGMPISLIEALACGCVPICTPVGGIVDVLSNGVSGFLSKSTSEDDYVEALKQFINNRNLIKRQNLVKIFEDNFSIDKCADRYFRIYSKR